jgi:hypothetical protein
MLEGAPHHRKGQGVATETLTTTISLVCKRKTLVPKRFDTRH